MKYRSLALAMAASSLATLAVAQSSNPVTLYGRVNVSFENIKVDGGSASTSPNFRKNEVVDNASRLGVRGSEDLGGGLKAIFQLETAFRADQTGSAWAGRDAWIGLTGGFGTFKMGRITSALYYATYDYVSLHNHDTGNSSDALLFAPALGQFRNNNTLHYTTPNFGPVNLQAEYSFLSEAINSDGSKPRHASITGNYDAGPIHAALGYAETRKFGGTNKSSVVTGALLWDAKSFIVGAVADRGKLDDAKRKVYWRLVGMVPFGATELHANYGRVGNLDATPSTVGDQTGAKQWTVGANYNLSKRTKVYAFYTKVDSEKNVYYGFQGLGNLATQAIVGTDTASLMLGARHNF